jgi:hypothetical protein
MKFAKGIPQCPPLQRTDRDPRSCELVGTRRSLFSGLVAVSTEAKVRQLQICLARWRCRGAQRSRLRSRNVRECRLGRCNWSGTCFPEVAMRRLVTLTLILTTATAVASVYVREASNRDRTQTLSPRQATVSPAEKTTRHGLIAHVDTRNRSLEIEVNGHQERIFWDERTLITVAKHRAKPSALAPGSTVFVDAQRREDRLQASLIAVSPPNLSW